MHSYGRAAAITVGPSEHEEWISDIQNKNTTVLQVRCMQGCTVAGQAENGT